MKPNLVDISFDMLKEEKKQERKGKERKKEGQEAGSAIERPHRLRTKSDDRPAGRRQA